jgi:dihydrodipicolinate synthase/N-acetylneuraminate lyase
VIIYNFPQATGYDIPAEMVIELAEHPNLMGIKESSGNVEKVRRWWKARDTSSAASQ